MYNNLHMQSVHVKDKLFNDQMNIYAAHFYTYDYLSKSILLDIALYTLP